MNKNFLIDFQVKIENTEYVIYGSEYIVSKDKEENLVCLFEDEDRTPCTYSVGKRFLEVYKPVF